MSEKNFLPKPENEKQKKDSQEEKIKVLRREVDLGPKSSDKDYTVHEKRISDLAEIENQEKKQIDSSQGNNMESFIKREYEIDIKNPEEKQGENMEAFIEREDGTDDKKENKDSSKKEGEILEMHDLDNKNSEENEIVELEDLEDKELIKLSNEMKIAREDYNKNKEKTASILEKIKNVFPKLVLGENSASVKESQEYYRRYGEARNNLLRYQAEKLKKRNLSPEKKKKEVAEMVKHYNEDEQYDSLDSKTGEKFNFSDEEEISNKDKIKVEDEEEKKEIKDESEKSEKKEKVENVEKAKEPKPTEKFVLKDKNSITDVKEKKISDVENKKRKVLEEMFEKYKINKKDNYFDQSGSFLDKLVREVAMGRYEKWKNTKDKKIDELINEKGQPKDETSKNIQKMEKYFETILGESAKIGKSEKFGKEETVKQWIFRIIEELLKAKK